MARNHPDSNRKAYRLVLGMILVAAMLAGLAATLIGGVIGWLLVGSALVVLAVGVVLAARYRRPEGRDTSL